MNVPLFLSIYQIGLGPYTYFFGAPQDKFGQIRSLNSKKHAADHSTCTRKGRSINSRKISVREDKNPVDLLVLGAEKQKGSLDH